MRLRLVLPAALLVLCACGDTEIARKQEIEAKAAAERAAQQSELTAAISKLGETPSPSAVRAICDSVDSFKVISESPSLRSVCGAAYMELAKQAIQQKDLSETKRNLGSAAKCGVGLRELLPLQMEQAHLEYKEPQNRDVEQARRFIDDLPQACSGSNYGEHPTVVTYTCPDGVSGRLEINNGVVTNIN